MVLHTLEIKVIINSNYIIGLIDAKIIHEQRNIGLFNISYLAKEINNLKNCPVVAQNRRF